MNKNENDIKIEIKADEDIAAGIFSNFSNISHSPEEFIIDFLFIHPTPPPGFGKLMSRIVLSPGHTKRILLTLTENLRDYEEQFGEISIDNYIDEVGSLQ